MEGKSSNLLTQQRQCWRPLGPWRRRQRRFIGYCGTVALLTSSSVSFLPSVQSFGSPALLRNHRSVRMHSNQPLLPPRHHNVNKPLFMVLTTPESIIEQASTQKLLDDLIDESVRTSARRPIMLQFDPSSGWIWRRWTGTVFSETWRSCVTNMLYAAIMFWIYRTNPVKIKDQLAGFNVLWGQLLQVTTFTLTFFVNQSYALWRKCSELSRRLQGRLNDIGMFLAPHAARKTPSSPSEPSTYTTASRQLLELVSRYVRLFNLLTYASFTRSHRPILTPRGMRRLVERGLMTAQERQVLVSSAIPATQRHNAVLLWIVRVFIEGRQHGHLVGGAGFENEFLEKVHVTRASYGAIGDELQGRMPLAYAHLVQVLVDVILWTYPVMAYTSGISPVLVILGTGLLTMSYQGLFDLAKQFLDPYDNENYGKGEDPLCVDTLIAETNAGSIRWMNSFEEMPFSAQRIKDGELFEYLLPVRGFSVEELQEQEKLLKEQRERDERIKKDEEELMRKLENSTLGEDQVLGMNATENITLISAEGMNETSVDSEFNVTVSNQTDARENETADYGPSAVDKSKVLHKVTSLGSGMPVSFNPQQNAESNQLVESDSPLDSGAIPTIPPPMEPQDTLNGVQPDPASAAGPESMVNGGRKVVGSLTALDPVITDEEDTTNPLIALDSLSDLPVFDEVGPDGADDRLGPMLTKEEWTEEQKTPKDPLTLEEYKQRVDEIIEAAKNELRETEAILRLEPGSQAFPDPLADEQKQNNPARFDQTKLDGKAQSRGLSPGDSSESKEAPTLDGSQFDGTSQLQGISFLPSSLVPTDNSEVLEPWGDIALDDIGEQQATLSVGDNGNQQDYSIDDLKSSWAEKVLLDGKGRRLADNAWENTLTINPNESFRAYDNQVEDIWESAEEELLETEAILKAPPGASSLDIPEKERGHKTKPTNATLPAIFDEETSKEGLENRMLTVNATAPMPIGDEDLEALEMDVKEKIMGATRGAGVEVESQKPVVVFREGDNQTLTQDEIMKA